MIEYLEDEQLWRIACDVDGCEAERLDTRLPARPDDALKFMRRAAVYWGWRDGVDGQKTIHLCPDHAAIKDRDDADARFAKFWRDKVVPKIDAARAARHERERLGLR